VEIYSSMTSEQLRDLYGLEVQELELDSLTGSTVLMMVDDGNEWSYMLSSSLCGIYLNDLTDGDMENVDEGTSDYVERGVNIATCWDIPDMLEVIASDEEDDVDRDRDGEDDKMEMEMEEES